MAEGFDSYAGQKWVYPNNMPVRGYQKKAVEVALFNNAMIVLPTGFGKTFIAAVVMNNFYRWYPCGKIIFVAPTRPLVAQQIQECRKISGIPSSDCIELTGSVHSSKRDEFWRSKRVFFATPQVIENDLDNAILPAKQIRCIVIDEAHRAQGGYAYCNIIKLLHQRNPNGFRVLALSATPGSDIQRVQQVMINLLISEVMFRSESALDLMQYKNEKSVKAWTVELTGKHKEFVETFIRITSPTFKELYKAGLTFSGDSIEKVAKYTLIKASQETIRQISGKTKGRLGFYCGAAISMSQQFELLTLYGIRVFYSSIMRAMGETRNGIKVALAASPEFDRMLTDIRNMFGEDVEPDANKEAKADLFMGHPKLKVVKDLLVKHFAKNDGTTETRAMVFTKYRESVSDIVQALKTVEGMKTGAFVGQGTAGNSGSGMKQREQLQMIQDFKAGKYNVLVATSVAEEGLDIGEIDLIICYDTNSSPISNMQRRGRTGRKRSGDVETILTKDYEEKKLKKAGNSRRQVEEQLYKRENYMSHRYHNAPRMVPDNIVPLCLEQKIFPLNDDEEDNQASTSKPKRAARKRTVKDDEDKDDDLKKVKKKKNGSFTLAKSLLDSDDGEETLELSQEPNNNNRRRRSKNNTSIVSIHKSLLESDDEFETLELTQEPNNNKTTTSNVSSSNNNSNGNSSQMIIQETKTQVVEILKSDSDIEWESDLEYNCV